MERWSNAMADVQFRFIDLSSFTSSEAMAVALSCLRCSAARPYSRPYTA